MADELEALFNQLSINEETVGTVERTVLDDVLGATEMLRGTAQQQPFGSGGGVFGQQQQEDPAQAHARQVEGMRRLRKCLSATPPPIDAVLDTGIWSLAAYFLDHRVPHNSPTMVYEASWVILNLLSGAEEQVSKVVFSTTVIASLKRLLLATEVPIASREHAAWAIGNIMGTNHFFRMILVDEHRIVPALLAFLYDVKQCYQQMTRAASRERHEAAASGLMASAMAACQRGCEALSSEASGAVGGGGGGMSLPVPASASEALSEEAVTRIYTAGTSAAEGRGVFAEHDQHHRADAVSGAGAGASHSTVLSVSEVKVLSFHFSHHWAMLLEQCRFQTVLLAQQQQQQQGQGQGHDAATALLNSVILDGIITDTEAYQRASDAVLASASRRLGGSANASSNNNGGGSSATLFDFGMGIPMDSDALGAMKTNAEAAFGAAANHLNNGNGMGMAAASSSNGNGEMGSPATTAQLHLVYSGATRLVSVRWLLLTALRNGLWSLANTVRPMTMPPYSQAFYDSVLSSPQQHKFMAEERARYEQHQRDVAAYNANLQAFYHQQQSASAAAASSPPPPPSPFVLVESSANTAQRVHHRYAQAANMVLPAERGGNTGDEEGHHRELTEAVTRRAATVRHSPPLAYVRIAFPCLADFVAIPDAEGQKEVGWAIEFAIMALGEAAKPFGKSEYCYLPCPTGAYSFDAEAVQRELSSSSGGGGGSDGRWWVPPGADAPQSSVPYRHVGLFADPSDSEEGSTRSLPWPLGLASHSRLFDTLNQSLYAANRQQQQQKQQQQQQSAAAAGDGGGGGDDSDAAAASILFDRSCVEVTASDALFSKMLQSRSFGPAAIAAADAAAAATASVGSAASAADPTAAEVRWHEREERAMAALCGWDEGTSFLFSEAAAQLAGARLLRAQQQQQQQQQGGASATALLRVAPPPPLFQPRVQPTWWATTPYFMLNTAATAPPSGYHDELQQQQQQGSFSSATASSPACLLGARSDEEVLAHYLVHDLRLPTVLQSALYHFVHTSGYCSAVECLRRLVLSCPARLARGDNGSQQVAPVRFTSQSALFAFVDRIRAVVYDPFIIGYGGAEHLLACLTTSSSSSSSTAAAAASPAITSQQVLTAQLRIMEPATRIAPPRVLLQLASILDRRYDAGYAASLRRVMRLLKITVDSSRLQTSAAFEKFLSLSEVLVLTPEEEAAAAAKAAEDREDGILPIPSSEVYSKAQANAALSDPKYNEIMLAKLSAAADTSSSSASSGGAPPLGPRGCPLAATPADDRLPLLSFLHRHPTGAAATALATIDFYWFLQCLRVTLAGTLGPMVDVLAGQAGIAAAAAARRSNAAAAVVVSEEAVAEVGRAAERVICDGFANCFDFPSPTPQALEYSDSRRMTQITAEDEAAVVVGANSNAAGSGQLSRTDGAITGAASSASEEGSDPLGRFDINADFTQYSPSEKMSVYLAVAGRSLTLPPQTLGTSLAFHLDLFNGLLGHAVPLCAQAQLGPAMREHAADVSHYHSRCLTDFSAEAATGYGQQYNCTVAQSLGMLGGGGGGGGGLVSPFAAWYGLVQDLMRIVEHWRVAEVPPLLTTAGGGGSVATAEGGNSALTSVVPVDAETFQRFLATALFVAPNIEHVYIGPPSAAVLAAQQQYAKRKEGGGGEGDGGQQQQQQKEQNLASILFGAAASSADDEESTLFPHLHPSDTAGIQLSQAQLLADVLAGGLTLVGNAAASSLPFLLMTRRFGSGFSSSSADANAAAIGAAYGGVLGHVGPVAAYCVTLLESVHSRGWAAATEALYRRREHTQNNSGNNGASTTTATSSAASTSSSPFSFAFAAGSKEAFLNTRPYAASLLCGQRRQPLSPAFLHFMTELPKFVEFAIVRGIQGIEERSPGLIGCGLQRREEAVQRARLRVEELKAAFKACQARLMAVTDPSGNSNSNGGGVSAEAQALAHQLLDVEEALADAEQSAAALDEEGEAANYHRFGIPFEYSRLTALLRHVFTIVLEVSRQLECWCKRRLAAGHAPNSVDWSAAGAASSASAASGVSPTDGSVIAEAEEVGGHVLTISATLLGRKGFVDAEGHWWNAVPPSWEAAVSGGGSTPSPLPQEVLATLRAAASNNSATAFVSSAAVPWVPLLVPDPQSAEAAAVGTHPPSRGTAANYGGAALRAHNANTTNARLHTRACGGIPFVVDAANAPSHSYQHQHQQHQHHQQQQQQYSNNGPCPMTPIEMAAATTVRNVPVNVTTAHVARLMHTIVAFAQYLEQLTYVPVVGATAALGGLVMAQATLTLGAVQSL